MTLSGEFGLFLILGGIGLVFSLIAWLEVWLFAPSWRGRPARWFWLTVLVSLIVAAAGIGVYQELAAYYRRDPPGTGLERVGQARETYVFWARIAFFSLYGFFVLVAGGIGYLAGWLQGRFAISYALTVPLAVLLFLLLTLRIVDYETGCSVGESFIFDLSCG